MENAKKFIIDDGSKEYCFENNFGEVFAKFRFNPVDTGILSRYKEVVEYLEGIELEDGFTEEKIIEIDKGISEKFAYLLNTESDIFAKYTPCTLFANGDYYVEKALTIIGDIIEDETGQRLKKKVAKMKKLAAKNGK